MQHFVFKKVCPLQFSREAYLRHRVIFVRNNKAKMKPYFSMVLFKQLQYCHFTDNQVTGSEIMSKWGIKTITPPKNYYNMESKSKRFGFDLCTILRTCSTTVLKTHGLFWKPSASAFGTMPWRWEFHDSVIKSQSWVYTKIRIEGSIITFQQQKNNFN